MTSTVIGVVSLEIKNCVCRRSLWPFFTGPRPCNRARVTRQWHYHFNPGDEKAGPGDGSTRHKRLSFFPANRDAVGNRQHHHVDAIIARQEIIQLADRACIRGLITLIEHLAVPQHVIN